MNLVVGSGPSGAAAASALLDAGKEVLMLDIGRVREAHPSRDPRAGDDPARKLVRGSAYPYLSDREAGLVQKGTRCLASGGKGGLSAVWGASVLPFPEEELAEWPFPAQELRPFYAKAAALLGVSGVPDDLASLFPFHAPPLQPLNPSLQAQSVLAHFNANAVALKAAGFIWGRARHAVRSGLCDYNGGCLSGCPTGAIFDAAQAVDSLLKRPGFRYEGGVTVLSVEEREGGVRLHAARAGASRSVYDGARVFIACGPLATARLVLGSFGAPEKPLELKTQPYFLLPICLDRDVPGAPEAALHTLAQAFLDFKDPAVSKRLVHLQIYGHNEFIAEKLAPAPGFVKRHFAPRLLAIQGYLHSDEAAPISVTASGKGEDCRLTLRAGERREGKAAARRAAAKLAAHAEELGFTTMRFMMKAGRPGEGNHAGGLFPMRAKPGPWETDALGRLGGRANVHLVDSSVLPTMPASTFTYAVMANAGRIATRAAA